MMRTRKNDHRPLGNDPKPYCLSLWWGRLAEAAAARRFRRNRPTKLRDYPKSAFFLCAGEGKRQIDRAVTC